MATADARELIVAERDDDARLDQVLARAFADLSRSQIQRLIRDGHVTVDAAAETKSGRKVRAGAHVHVAIPEPPPATPEPEDLPIGIVYADDDLVVVNKPAGMVVHPAAGHHGGTLVNALLHHIGGLSAAGGTDRPGIVHRLDKGTSGLIVIARNDAAHRAISAQFQDRTVIKDYLALVWGAMAPGQTMDKAIGRDPRHRMKMSTRGRHTRSALTTIVGVEPLRGVSLATVRIGTGRTHQIRVHLSEAGHPVVGDDTYGGIRRHPPVHLRAVLKLTRPFLHAWRLSLLHPRTHQRLAFEAPLPDDLTTLLAALRDPFQKASPSDE